MCAVGRRAPTMAALGGNDPPGRSVRAPKMPTLPAPVAGEVTAASGAGQDLTPELIEVDHVATCGWPSTSPAPLTRGTGPVHAIEDPTTLHRLLDATLLLDANLDLPVLLRHVAQEACSMTGARYGALGVLNDDCTALAEFITAGLEPEAEERIGSSPTGRGVLGVLISDPAPLRLAHLGDHAESVGFPPNHPPMTSFLGVPIKVHDRVYGNLYLTDKAGGSEFTNDDEALVTALAFAAGIAIENAQFHQRAQEVALFDERDRVASDLHDTVIQRMFRAGLDLQGIAGMITPGPAVGRLQAVVDDIDETIRELRSTIFTLAFVGKGREIRARVLSLLAELRVVVGFEIRATFVGPVDSRVSDPLAEHLLAVVREAVTNIGRHAQATQASIRLSADDGHCRLRVVDNGQGLGSDQNGAGGMGLVNLRHRAEKLQGEFAVERPISGGTVLTWQVPLDRGN